MTAKKSVTLKDLKDLESEAQKAAEELERWCSKDSPEALLKSSLQSAKVKLFQAQIEANLEKIEGFEKDASLVENARTVSQQEAEELEKRWKQINLHLPELMSKMTNQINAAQSLRRANKELQAQIDTLGGDENG